MIALPWKKLCANFILPCGENHYGFFLRCPTSFYNQPSDIFSNNAIYIESWGPEYHGIKKIILWFEEWNTRGTVLQWDIKQFFHKDNQTIVEWYFKNKMDDGNVEAFDGISLIEWTPDDKIALLKEFGCNENRYDPYKDGTIPHFRDENAMWF